MKLAHIAIKVDDLEAAGEFYENFLGFRDVRQGVNRDHYSRHMTDGNIDVALVRQVADRRVPRADLAVAAIDDPAQYSEILAKARPQVVAGIVLTEPVDVENFWQLLRLFSK